MKLHVVELGHDGVAAPADEEPLVKVLCHGAGVWEVGGSDNVV
jgi:hypothetical protein